MNSALTLLNFARQMNAWKSLNRTQRTFAIGVVIVALASIAYAFILKTGIFGDRPVTAIDDIGEALAAAIASAACAWAATRAGGKERLAWTLMSISTGLWAAGEVAWSVYEVGLRVTVPSPGLPDVGFLAAVPFAIAGIRAFWSDAARGTSTRWRVWFDALIVAIALTSTAWAFGLREVYEANSDWGTKALSLAYPVGDILIGTVLILAIRRATHQQAGRMALLLAGVAAYSIADSAFAYLTAHGSYASVGSVLNTGWFTGFLLVALSATYPSAPARIESRPARLDLWQLALPWMTLLLASAGDVYSSISGGGIDLFMSSMTALLALLLTVNMIIERREFLGMLNEAQDSQLTLDRDVKAGLEAIARDSERIEGEELAPADARRLASEIRDNAERLDRLVEEML